jgi:hypothetical protein
VGAVIRHTDKKYVYRPWADFTIGETLTGTLIMPPKPSKDGSFWRQEAEHAQGECLCGCAPGHRTGFCITAAIDEVRYLPIGARIRITVRGRKVTGNGYQMWDMGLLIDRSRVPA